MTIYLWAAGILTALLILLGILAVLVVLKRRREGRQIKINYFAFFILGIVFIPLGLILMYVIDFGFMGLAALGIIYVYIGLSHRH
jgi:hypothetical protein